LDVTLRALEFDVAPKAAVLAVDADGRVVRDLQFEYLRRSLENGIKNCLKCVRAGGDIELDCLAELRSSTSFTIDQDVDPVDASEETNRSEREYDL
jgi:hypothetical protein